MTKAPMNEKQKMMAGVRRQVRVKLFFIGMVFVTFLLLIAARTLAWFTDNKEARIRSVEMKVTDTQSLMISVRPTLGWQTSLETQFDPMYPLCGDGLRFFAPVIDAVTTTDTHGASMKYRQVVACSGPLTDAELGEMALVLDFYLKTDEQNQNVFLTDTSYLAPNLEASVENTPQNSNINVGHIAGAMRASLSYWDPQDGYQLCAVWFPNARCELAEDGSTDSGYAIRGLTEGTDGSVTYAGNREETYILTDHPGPFDDPPTNTVETNDVGYVIEDGVIYIWDLQKALADEKPVFTRMRTNYDEKFRLVVWVEGTDRECENILAGGKMDLHLAFTQNPNLTED